MTSISRFCFLSRLRTFEDYLFNPKIQMRISIFYLLGCLWLLSACQVQEEIHFKQDFSGQMTYTLDLSGMKAMTQMMQNMGDSTLTNPQGKAPDIEMNQMLDSLPKLPQFAEIQRLKGISEVRTENREGKLQFSFNFADLEALNTAYDRLSNSSKILGSLGSGQGGFNIGETPTESNEPAKEEKVFQYFAKKGKTLTYRRPKTVQEEMKDAPPQMEMMKSMGQLFKFETRLTFDRKVGKTTQKNAEISTEEKALTVTHDFQSAAKGDTEVKLKLK
jgi:hypothetical protein